MIAYLMLQSQYEADQRDSHHQDQQHEDIFRGSRQQNSGKLIFDQSIASTKTKYIKLNTKTQIFF